MCSHWNGSSLVCSTSGLHRRGGWDVSPLCLWASQPHCEEAKPKVSCISRLPQPPFWPEEMESSRRLPLGWVHLSLPPPPPACHWEVPDEREGGLPDVASNVLQPGAPRRQAALQRLPDQARQGGQLPQGALRSCLSKEVLFVLKMHC